MTERKLHIVHFNAVRWETMQQHGFRKTSGKMFQQLAAHPLVSQIWYVQLDRRIGWTLRHEQVSDKVHIIGLPNGIRGEVMPVFGRLNISHNARILSRHLALHLHSDDVPVYWFFDWGMATLLHQLPRALTVMEITDHAEDITGRTGRYWRKLQRAKQQATEITDLAIAVSPRLLPDLAACRGEVTVEYNAISNEFLTLARSAQPEPHGLRNMGRPRLGVIGSSWSLNNRVDHQLLARTMDLLPDWQLVLVGCDHPAGQLAELGKRPNVHILGMQSQMALPAIIQHFDVCSVPYKKGPPRGDALKTYEYAACRRPTILTADEPHPALRDFTRTVDNAEDFAQACRQLLTTPINLSAIDHVMNELTWEARAARWMASAQQALATQCFAPAPASQTN